MQPCRGLNCERTTTAYDGLCEGTHGKSYADCSCFSKALNWGREQGLPVWRSVWPSNGHPAALDPALVDLWCERGCPSPLKKHPYTLKES